jgi:hypothetical protein
MADGGDLLPAFRPCTSGEVYSWSTLDRDVVPFDECALLLDEASGSQAPLTLYWVRSNQPPPLWPDGGVGPRDIWAVLTRNRKTQLGRNYVGHPLSFAEVRSQPCLRPEHSEPEEMWYLETMQMANGDGGASIERRLGTPLQCETAFLEGGRVFHDDPLLSVVFVSGPRGSAFLAYTDNPFGRSRVHWVFPDGTADDR